MNTIPTPQFNWNEIETILPALPRFRMASPKTIGCADPGNKMLMLCEGEGSDSAPTLAAVVPKKHAFLQHEEVLGQVVAWVRTALGVEKPKVRVSLDESQSKAEFHLGLGQINAFSPDGLPIELNLVCSNCVTVRDPVVVGLRWHRPICGNGMAAGVSMATSWHSHVHRLELEPTLHEMRDRIEQCHKDAERVQAWRELPVALDTIADLANGAVRRRWGNSPATRLWHICQSGYDVKPVPPYKGGRPTDQNLRYIGVVPGAPKRAANLFDVAQALSWIASRAKDIDTVATRQAEIGHMIRPVMPNA